MPKLNSNSKKVNNFNLTSAQKAAETKKQKTLDKYLKKQETINRRNKRKNLTIIIDLLFKHRYITPLEYTAFQKIIEKHVKNYNKHFNGLTYDQEVDRLINTFKQAYNNFSDIEKQEKEEIKKQESEKKQKDELLNELQMLHNIITINELGPEFVKDIIVDLSNKSINDLITKRDYYKKLSIESHQRYEERKIQEEQRRIKEEQKKLEEEERKKQEEIQKKDLIKEIQGLHNIITAEAHGYRFITDIKHRLEKESFDSLLKQRDTYKEKVYEIEQGDKLKKLIEHQYNINGINSYILDYYRDLIKYNRKEILYNSAVQYFEQDKNGNFFKTIDLINKGISFLEEITINNEDEFGDYLSKHRFEIHTLLSKKINKIDENKKEISLFKNRSHEQKVKELKNSQDNHIKELRSVVKELKEEENQEKEKEQEKRKIVIRKNIPEKEKEKTKESIKKGKLTKEELIKKQQEEIEELKKKQQEELEKLENEEEEAKEQEKEEEERGEPEEPEKPQLPQIIEPVIKWSVDLVILVQISGVEDTRTPTKEVISTKSRLEDSVRVAVEQYITEMGSPNDIVGISAEYSAVPYIGGDEIMGEIDLREIKYLKLEGFDVDEEFLKNNKKYDNNCVINILKLKYGKNRDIGMKKIKEFFKDIKINANNVIKFCEHFRIKCILYGVNKQILGKNMNYDDKYKALLAVCYNNHIYPVQDNFLKKTHKTTNVEFIKNGLIKLKEFIKEGIYPNDITLGYEQKRGRRIILKGDDINELIKMKMDEIERNIQNKKKDLVEIKNREEREEFDSIQSFKVGDTHYVKNNHYEECKNILEKFDMEDFITPLCSINHLFGLINKKLQNQNGYKEDCILSFFPTCTKFRKSPYVYFNDDYKTKKVYDKDIYHYNKKLNKIITIDKCFSYGSSLADIPFLIQFDMRTDRIRTITNQDMKLVDHHLYVVKPPKEQYIIENLLLPETGLYAGYYLKRCRKEGLKFELVEELFTRQISNYFTQMITDLINKADYDTAKSIMVIGIGKMETNNSKDFKVFDKLVNKQEAIATSGFSTTITTEDETYYLYHKIEKVDYVTNMFPISCQIKDEARWQVYKKIKSMKISDDNLVAIYCDSISFIDPMKPVSNVEKYANEKYDLQEKNIKKFKYVEICHSLVGYLATYSYEFKFKEIKDMSILNDSADRLILGKDYINNNYLRIDYAGGGKTTTILNKVIPDLEKEDDKRSYIVLTPSHISLLQYRQKKINCGIIQSYNWSGTIPREEVIIIDEIGLLDRKSQNFLYKCFINKKTIWAFGDYRQLLPVGEANEFSKMHYLKLVFE